MSDVPANKNSHHAVGIMNITLGAALIIDVVVLAIMAFGCLLMSFSLFFMAAIPAFLLIGGFAIATLIAAVINIGDGIGLIIAANKSRKVSTVFTVIAIVADGIMLPINIVALISGIYIIIAEMNFISVAVTITAALVILLALGSFILSIIILTQSRRVVPN